jgi:DNA-directed RNA polymerase subunit N (RpoN/RPB10)
MLIPVRCFTCGKVVPFHSETYQTILPADPNIKEKVLGDSWERFVLLEKKLRKEADEIDRAAGQHPTGMKRDG